MVVRVGQPVLVHGKRKGICQYVGKVKFGPGEWCGVELKKPSGNCDGQVKGHRYFTCKPNHGIFVSISDVSDVADPEANATRIQSLYRGRKERAEIKQKISYQKWNQMDMQDEADFLQQQQEFARVNAVLQQRASTPTKSSRMAKGFLEQWRKQMAELVVEPDYRGLKLSTPPTEQEVTALVDAYRRDPDGTRLHKKIVWRLIINMIAEYDQIPDSVLDLQSPSPGRLVVVGDTHGQLNDVLWIFHSYGFPSPTNHYLFNGDIADRGEYAMEIFIILAAYLEMYPGCIQINRGNHENAEMNRRERAHGGGFHQECRTKYDLQTFQLMQVLFNVTPLATIVNQQTIVLHGGLFRKNGVMLQHIRELNRRQQCPETPTTYQECIFFDMLWSDPMAERGHQMQPARGPGCTRFGPDVTERFVKANGLARCVRSHEVPSTLRGFEVHHNARCITIFSASNYCGATGNYGGVMIFDSAEDRPEIKEHWAPPLEQQHAELYGEHPPSPSSSAQREHDAQQKMDADVLAKAKQLIAERKRELEWYFVRADQEKRGFITVDAWSEGMIAVLERELNYRKLQSELVELEPNGMINYKKFLSRFRMATGEKHAEWQQQVLSSIWGMLMKCDYNLKDTMSVFDPSGDGLVSTEEFSHLLEMANSGLSNSQIEALVEMMYPIGVKNVEVADFINRFRCFYQGPTQNQDPTTQAMLQRIGAQIRIQSGSLDKLFDKYDADRNGFLEYDEFKAVMRDMRDRGIEITDAEIDALTLEVDADSNGKINYLEFVNAFSEPDNVALNAVDEIVQSIARTFYKIRGTLRSAFAQLDQDNLGHLSVEDFQMTLETVNSLLPQPISRQQIEFISNYVPKESDGKIDYEEFLDTLVVQVDNQTISTSGTVAGSEGSSPPMSP